MNQFYTIVVKIINIQKIYCTNLIEIFRLVSTTLPMTIMTLSIRSAFFLPSFSPLIPPTKAPLIDPITNTLAEKLNWAGDIYHKLLALFISTDVMRYQDIE